MAENKVGRYYFLAIRAASQMLVVIAAPAVLALFLRGLYREAELAELIFGLTLTVAFLISLAAGWLTAKSYGEEYKKLISSD